jgi:hypothetical protein
MSYIIRTVTYFHIGKLQAVYDKELVLQPCVWLADAGQWSVALKTGAITAFEEFPFNDPVIVSREGLIDVAVWNHPIPQAPKS